MVTVLDGVANLAMSLVYLCYGTMTLFDLRDGWHDRTRRRFGLGFLAIMFTCGPHHLEHGLHVLFTDVEGQWLHIAVVAIGLPTGLLWFGLRLEAMLGGRGDRTIQGLPTWLALLPILGASYLAITVSGTSRIVQAETFDPVVIPNLVITVLYLGIGATLAATQVRNHVASGQWSASGLSLAGVFLTCALMHLVYAGYGLTGQYEIDSHILPFDIAAVPGGAYFLWLVTRVHRGDIGRRADARRAAQAARAAAARDAAARVPAGRS